VLCKGLSHLRLICRRVPCDEGVSCGCIAAEVRVVCVNSLPDTIYLRVVIIHPVPEATATAAPSTVRGPTLKGSIVDRTVSSQTCHCVIVFPQTVWIPSVCRVSIAVCVHVRATGKPNGILLHEPHRYRIIVARTEEIPSRLKVEFPPRPPIPHRDGRNAGAVDHFAICAISPARLPRTIPLHKASYTVQAPHRAAALACVHWGAAERLHRAVLVRRRRATD